MATTGKRGRAMFRMPKFEGGDINTHFRMQLHALGLLEEDEDSEAALANAKAELARRMSRFRVNDLWVNVGPDSFKTAAFLYGLMLEKGLREFVLTIGDIKRLFKYWTASVLDDRKRNPGKHAVMEEVFRTVTKTAVAIPK